MAVLNLLISKRGQIYNKLGRKMEKKISAENLCKVYKGKSAALDRINFQLRENEIVGLIGKNGAGKTTLIKLLLGLLKVTSGQISVLNLNPSTDSYKIRQVVGYCPENVQFHNYWSVKDIIKLTALCYANWDRDLEDNLTDFFELAINKKVKQLSFGMRRKLSLLLALCITPSILFLDEPFSNLDPSAKRIILKAIHMFKEKYHCSILVSSHLMYDLEKVITRVYMIDKGMLLCDKEREDVEKEYRHVKLLLHNSRELSADILKHLKNVKIENGFIDANTSCFSAVKNNLGKDLELKESTTLSLEDVYFTLLEEKQK